MQIFDFNSWISAIDCTGFLAQNSSLQMWNLQLSILFQDFINIQGEKKITIYQKSAHLWILRTGEVIRENRYKGAPVPYENRGSYLIICKPDQNTLSPQIYYSPFSKSDNNIFFSSLLISLTLVFSQ